ncbi:unnamed protein product [Somion occarium]|uniref:N-acetylglucosaminylphosphatidylinositol deacetylase n=1 Tax=Somion occarium TaxID=3059160 RepID=A0ABP1CYR8_9APHY
MSILRFSLPLLVVSLLANVLLTPLRSGIDSILPPSNNILLLTAHPDDECMFFAPTILSLTKYHVNEKRPNLYSLCLSVGNAEGLGNIRRDELQRSLDVLGVDQGRRWVVDHPELPDNMTVHWDAHAIADVVRPYIVKYNIGTVLTFDRRGISSHPNHYSLPNGIIQLIRDSASNGATPPRLFSLITVPLGQKYIGPIAPLLAKLDLHVASLLDGSTKAHVKRLPVFVSGVEDFWLAIKAMLEHESQMIWFRWLYVAFSRYTWLNEWVEVVPTSSNL